MWRVKPPLGAHAILKAPDVRITNQGDKDIHLPKILKLDEEVRNRYEQQHHAPGVEVAYQNQLERYRESRCGGIGNDESEAIEPLQRL